MLHDSIESLLYNSRPSDVIGITSGCFDLLHVTHISYLERCRRRCDKLFVFLDSDMMILENKGYLPVINENDRAFCLSAIKYVSGVIIIDSLEDFSNKVYACSHYKQDQKSSNSIGCFKKVIVFKNTNKIYGSDLIAVPGSVNEIIPDISRFENSTEIRKFIKEKYDFNFK